MPVELYEHNTLDCYKSRFDPSDAFTALQINKRVLTFRLYSDFPDNKVDEICEMLLNAEYG